MINGDNATPHSWPWQISLRVSGHYGSKHFCGGSLIRPNWVVTAAHCVYKDMDPSGYTVVVGEIYIQCGFADSVLLSVLPVQSCLKAIHQSKFNLNSQNLSKVLLRVKLSLNESSSFMSVNSFSFRLFFLFLH